MFLEVFFIALDGNNRVVEIDTHECVFKVALMKKKYDEVMSMIRNSDFLCDWPFLLICSRRDFQMRLSTLLEMRELNSTWLWRVGTLK